MRDKDAVFLHLGVPFDGQGLHIALGAVGGYCTDFHIGIVLALHGTQGIDIIHGIGDGVN